MINLPAWIFWTVGTLGVGGTIVALVLAPAATVAILQAVWRAFLACSLCQVLALVILTGVACEMWGFSRAAKQCRDNELRAELKAKQRDIETANQAAQDADARAADVEKRAHDKSLADEAYIDDLKKRPAFSACILGDGDVRGLRESNPDGARARPAAGARVHGRR